MNDFEMESIFELMGTRLKRPDRGGNRSGECPLAPWLHTKGRDKHPSLTAKFGDPPVFKCWACGSAGTFFHLAKLYGEYSGDYRPMDLLKDTQRNGVWGRKEEYGIKYKRVGKLIQARLEKEITEEKLSSYLQLVPDYAFERGISRDQVLKWEIGYDQRENRMIFTVRDHYGKLAGVSGRAISPDTKPKYKHYTGLKKESVLYGEKFIDRAISRAYIVEGFMDVLALERHGIRNALGSMGTSLSETQMQKLDRFCREVIFVPDIDDQGAGLQFAQTFAEKLYIMGKKAGIAGVTMNPDYIHREKPRLWEPCDYRVRPLPVLQQKDPADLNADELQQVLANVCWIDLKPRDKKPDDWLR